MFLLPIFLQADILYLALLDPELDWLEILTSPFQLRIDAIMPII